jgi:uncharacterized protein
MPDPASPAAVFDQLVRGVCDRRWDELPGLYAEQTYVVHPHDPRRSTPLTTRQQLADHFRRSGAALGEVRFEPAAITVHQTADPEVIVGEFEYRGVIPGSMEPFAARNVFVIRVRDGQIIESRDYVDHGEIARVLAAASRASAPAGSDAAPRR